MAAENGAGGIDPDVERLLTSCGVTEWRLVPHYRIDKIDERSSFGNQARPLIGGIDEDKVLMMMEALEQDGRTVLPAILVKASQRGRGKILNGNHRYQAWKLFGFETIPVVEIPHGRLTDQQEAVLIYTANIGLGTETSLTERVRQAVALIEQFGIAQVEAARLLRIPEQRVYTHRNRTRALTRFEALGLKGHRHTIPETGIERLGSIQSDEVMVEAAKLAGEARLKSDDINDLVKRINQARSEKSKLAIVDRAREELAREVQHTAAGKIPKPTAVANLQQLLTRLLRFNVDEYFEAIDKITPEQRDDIRQRAAQAAERLRAIAA
jgi:ParB-like chromosome segregation protein Spo0J